MGKLRNTLAAISILLLASCGGNKDYYMFTSFHEPADEGLRYLYSEECIPSVRRTLPDGGSCYSRRSGCASSSPECRLPDGRPYRWSSVSAVRRSDRSTRCRRAGTGPWCLAASSGTLCLRSCVQPSNSAPSGTAPV